MRLNELRKWLTKCDYPMSIINKGIHNARLQGPAPKPMHHGNIIPFVTSYVSNYNFQHLLQSVRCIINSTCSSRITEVFKDAKFVLGLRQPQNILRQLTRAQFKSNPCRETENEEPGLFAECTDPRCELCGLGYIQQCKTFITANKQEWFIRCHINCNSKNVLYYLVCNMCEGSTTYTGKTKTRLRDRLNNHISSCRSGETSDRFDRHVHKCGLQNGNLKPPYFKVYAFMKLKHPEKLISYEKTLHRRKLDTMN